MRIQQLIACHLLPFMCLMLALLEIQPPDAATGTSAHASLQHNTACYVAIDMVAATFTPRLLKELPSSLLSSLRLPTARASYAAHCAGTCSRPAAFSLALWACLAWTDMVTRYLLSPACHYIASSPQPIPTTYQHHQHPNAARLSRTTTHTIAVGNGRWAGGSGPLYSMLAALLCLF